MIAFYSLYRNGIINIVFGGGVKMVKTNLFFSWASEFNDNKKFILDVLNKTKEILKLNDIDLDVQESTNGVNGFVKIDDVIFERIEKCDFFVADLSPICEHKDKKLPNPNVCFELGYMIGRHGESRVFGMYNEETVKNPSKELPFDFSHNRTMKFKINKDLEAKIKKIEEYASIIAKVILDFFQKGDLHSRQPLKNNDIELNDKIKKNMENFKFLVTGFTERLEVYNDRDYKKNLPGEYEFMSDFAHFLNVSTNRFSNDSLEVFRNKLKQAIDDFIWKQVTSTFDYLGNNVRCTKRYLILEHPSIAVKEGFPYIPDGDETADEIQSYVKEANEYRKSAYKILEIYEELEKRYIYLVD